MGCWAARDASTVRQGWCFLNNQARQGRTRGAKYTGTTSGIKGLETLKSPENDRKKISK
jgi:hypothetical protein